MKKFILPIIVLIICAALFGCTQEARDSAGIAAGSQEPILGERTAENQNNNGESLLEETSGAVQKQTVLEQNQNDPIPAQTEAAGTIITPVDKVNTDKLTLLDGDVFDFDKDGTEEKIRMYTEAQKDSSGEILWDDGQNWLFVVQDTEKDYILAQEYVQLGTIEFYIYTIGDKFHIGTISARTASLVLTSYYYDKDKDCFVLTVPFSTEGNVCMYHTPA